MPRCLAGVGRVPIAVILMVTEMTGSLSFIIPAMVAVVVAYFFVGPKYTIYKSQVLSRADSPAHRGEYNIPIMSAVKVSEAMNKTVITMSPDDSVDRALAVMTEKKFRGLPIVQSGGHVVGIVTMSDALRVPGAEMKSTLLKDIMPKNVVSVSPEDSLLDALSKMTTNGIGRLPVVNNEANQIVGILTRSDLFRTYQSHISSVDQYQQLG